MDVVISIPAARRATYVVTGTTFDALSRQMSARGEWAAFTGGLTVDPRGTPVTRVTVSCRPTITMPEWRERSDASRPMQAEWDRMIAALERHEMGHDAILRQVANGFRDAVNAADPPPDRRALRRMARALLRDHIARQRAYDRSTNQGANDGVRLDDPR
jgi:predicted secreted Zn-dependent protease